MAKAMTKTQKRRLAKEILSKAQKLWTHQTGALIMSTKDYIAIEAIVTRTLKRIG